MNNFFKVMGVSMCEYQYFDNTVLYGELFTGWYLMRCIEDSPYLKKNEWCLMESNGPAFLFMVTPVIDSSNNMSDENFKATSDKIFKEMLANSDSPLDDFGRLYQSMRGAGFDQEEQYGAAIYWLCDLMAKMIRDNPYPNPI